MYIIPACNFFKKSIPKEIVVHDGKMTAAKRVNKNFHIQFSQKFVLFNVRTQLLLQMGLNQLSVLGIICFLNIVFSCDY